MSTTIQFPLVAWYTEGVDDYTAIGVTFYEPEVYVEPAYSYYSFEIVVDYVDDLTGESRRDYHYYTQYDNCSYADVIKEFEAEYLHEYFPPKS